MFTGLIKDCGIVETIAPAKEAITIRLTTKLSTQLNLGDSLAVNGVCLTVTAINGHLVDVIAVAETLDRTTLGKLKARHRVNLEPALRLGEPMGGHIVSGHVDGLGTIAQIQPRGASMEITVAAPAAIMHYIVEKGSVAMDGVSLTVAAVAQEYFRLVIIPHTWQATVLNERKPQEQVNLEVDVLAKYVAKMLGVRALTLKDSTSTTITESWLREQGF